LAKREERKCQGAEIQSCTELEKPTVPRLRSAKDAVLKGFCVNIPVQLLY
jgi:hypothetical protein